MGELEIVKMKIISSVLFAAALASPVTIHKRSGSGSGSPASGSPDSGSGSPKSGSGSPKSPQTPKSPVSPVKPPSGHSGKPNTGKPHTGKPHSGKPHHSKPEMSGVPQWEQDLETEIVDTLKKGDCKDCGTRILNNNYAPINNNNQNFVNIETDIDNDFNMNLVGQTFGKMMDWGKDWGKDWEGKDWGKDWEKDHEKDHESDWGNKDEEMDTDFGKYPGMEVDGIEFSLKEICSMIAKKLGLSPEDLKSLMEKEEVRMLIKDFFMKLSEEHNDKQDDPKIPDSTVGPTTAVKDMTTAASKPTKMDMTTGSK